MKVKDAYRDLARTFREAGFETPELDARLLTAAVADMTASEVMIGEKELDAAQQLVLANHRARHLAHEPVARILGKRGFWSFEVALSAATLEPRPDSETLIEAALDHLGTKRCQDLRIADLGTGSGILLIALLLECPNATGIGIDAAPNAVQTARKNAALNNLMSRAQFMCGDWLQGVDEKFDLIVTNPPYGTTQEWESLPDNVRLYDPRLAIDGGEDGLDAYHIIARDAAAHLVPGGLLVMEIGDKQAASVPALFLEKGYRALGQKRDLAGHVRALIFSADDA